MTTTSDKNKEEEEAIENGNQPSDIFSDNMGDSNHNGSNVPPSGAIVPGGPNGPDGTIIEEVSIKRFYQ